MHIGTKLGSTAHSRVYKQLKRAITSGEYLPGERLVVRKLAEQNRTSPMPVREALRQLAIDGAVMDHPNRGVIVPEARIETIADVMRNRCLIEGAAAEWAVLTINGRELRMIAELNEAMIAATEKGEVSGYLELNRQFHFRIYEAARSETLLGIIERLWLLAGPWLNFMREETTLGLGLDHHLDLVEGLKRADGVRVRQALVADITNAMEIILRAASTTGAQIRRTR